jgi:hypothetical protein
MTGPHRDDDISNEPEPGTPVVPGTTEPADPTTGEPVEPDTDPADEDDGA